MFPKVHITLGDGRTFEIERHGKGIYVQRMTFNGQNYASTWLPLGRLSKESNVMVVWVGEQPNVHWGVAPQDTLPSFDVQPKDGR